MTTQSMEFVAPLRVAFAIDGVELEITPVVMRELPGLVAIAGPVLAALARFDDAATARMRAGQPSQDDLQALFDLITQDAMPVIQAVAICARQPEEWVGNLMLDRFAELAAVCIEVNKDFFSRALPNLRRLGARLAPSATSTPSSSS